MTLEIPRSLIAALIAGTMCLAASSRPGAVAGTETSIDHFVAMAPVLSDPQAAGHVDIFIERWSTDVEHDQLAAAVAGGTSGALLRAVQKMHLRRAGVLLTPGMGGGLGARARARRARNLLFAYRVETSTGHQLILATDRALAFGEPEIAWPSTAQFTLVDIRLGPDGQGTGKIAAARQVALNKDTGTLELADYVNQPARLTNVRAEPLTRVPMPRPRRTVSILVNPAGGR